MVRRDTANRMVYAAGTRNARAPRTNGLPCRRCGDPASYICGKCGAPACASDTFFYVDDTNAAITRNSTPECAHCHPPKYPRPYSLARAVERGEWPADGCIRERAAA